ncbi:E3 ubiquitin-protein ligase NEURL3 [Pyxicephalus adspersus]|uniref:E3 ubiquitin-protein ligase NEURL3 n=1 Tax=Pyxicephalus adspersus TaxID=30357 RepID=A0AAV3B8B5_PYXAD|nr:TPA: hypothetical protein GDO54_007841 [Pyxicephalus adspersus]
MGLTCSSAKDAPGLSFHPHCKGSHISLNGCLHQARRSCSFHDGLVFSNRPLKPREKVWIKVLEEESNWHGSIRVGFTMMDPDKINDQSLPPFACPDLIELPGFWASGMPEEVCKKGAELCFWINRKGQVLFQDWPRSRPKVLFSGIPKKTPVWVMLDVYGKTKAVQLINHRSKQTKSNCCCHQSTTKVSTGDHDIGRIWTRDKSQSTLNKTSELRDHPLHKPRTMDLESDLEEGFPTFPLGDDYLCVICKDRLADTMLFPCCHRSFCESCAVKVKSQNNLCPLCRQTIVQLQNIGVPHMLMEPLS